MASGINNDLLNPLRAVRSKLQQAANEGCNHISGKETVEFNSYSGFLWCTDVLWG